MYSEKLAIKLAKIIDKLIGQYPDVEKEFLFTVEKYFPKTYEYYEQFKKK